MVTSSEPQKGGDGGLGALANVAQGRIRSLLTTYVVVGAAIDLGRRWVAIGRDKMTFTVTVNSDDDVFPDVHRWLLGQLPSRRRRALLARSNRPEYEEGRQIETPPLSLFYDGTKQQTVEIGEFSIKVHITKTRADDVLMSAGTEPAVGGPSSRARLPLYSEDVIFTCPSAPARDAVVAFLERTVLERRTAKDRPDFYLATRWGDWMRRRDLPLRALDTVVLAGGQRERIIEDLELFLRSEKRYDELGIPYHRGYLFHGPPGTGKTSIVKALAAHFGLNLYYLPLGEVPADSSLLQLVSRVDPRSVLLLEDVDVFQATQQRAEHDHEAPPAMSLAGLLNALDGVATPHGLITVMTANRPNVLDDALMRPGRIGLSERIGELDDDQLDRLVRVLTGRSLSLPTLDGQTVTAAAVTNAVASNLHDPAAAEQAIKTLLS